MGGAAGLRLLEAGAKSMHQSEKEDLHTQMQRRPYQRGRTAH